MAGEGAAGRGIFNAHAGAEIGARFGALMELPCRKNGGRCGLSREEERRWGRKGDVARGLLAVRF